MLSLLLTTSHKTTKEASGRWTKRIPSKVAGAGQVGHDKQDPLCYVIHAQNPQTKSQDSFVKKAYHSDSREQDRFHNGGACNDMFLLAV